MPASFTLQEVSGGVWAAIAPGTAGTAVSNAAIVDLGDKTVVVDTFMTRRAADEMATEVKRLTGRTPYLVVNSHWHTDHVGGNQAFAGVPIVGTRRMLELIIEDAPATREQFEARTDEIRTAADRLSASATTPEEKTRAAGTRALADALTADAQGYQLTLPDVLIGDRMEIEGERSLTIHGYGPGHTESDLFVQIDDVVISGDLVWTGVHPKTTDGFPAEWAAVLDRISRLGPARVVSGHGPPGTIADITTMADYLRQLDRLVTAVRAGEIDPVDAPPPPGCEDWEDGSRFQAGLAALAAR
jgi:glyoxylase-like metal-dependent hydrolase (beta-lactamase superfamily II)